MKDDSAEILFQSFLQEALVSSSGIGRDVHSLMWSIQHIFCRPTVQGAPEGWFWRGCAFCLLAIVGHSVGILFHYRKVSSLLDFDVQSAS